MKLFYSPTSPFVRKVMACAIACDLESQIETVTTDPWSSPAELLAQNPLSKVPCLVTEDGLALFDSPVICEYLNFVGNGQLVPPVGPHRWRALKEQAIADGIMDAAIIRRQESGRPQEAARAKVIDRQRGVMQRGLDLLEAEVPPDHIDIGTITVGCMLGYLDLRFADDSWRDRYPKLDAWQKAIMQHPELAKTAP